jgi:hypothetical protein
MRIGRPHDVRNGTWGWFEEGLGFAVEVTQWATEWGDSYRSGFSPEDLPSNSEGVSFGQFLNKHPAKRSDQLFRRNESSIYHKWICDMRLKANYGGKAARIIETVLLLGAIIIIIPPPPSATERIGFFPMSALSVIMFGTSRYIRHGSTGPSRFAFLAAEVLVFAGALYLLVRAANLLLETLPS